MDVVICSFQWGCCPIYLKSWKRFHRAFTVTNDTRGPQVCAASVASAPRAGTEGTSSWASSDATCAHQPRSRSPGRLYHVRDGSRHQVGTCLLVPVPLTNSEPGIQRTVKVCWEEGGTKGGSSPTHHTQPKKAAPKASCQARVWATIWLSHR